MTKINKYNDVTVEISSKDREVLEPDLLGTCEHMYEVVPHNNEETIKYRGFLRPVEFMDLILLTEISPYGRGYVINVIN